MHSCNSTYQRTKHRLQEHSSAHMICAVKADITALYLHEYLHQQCTNSF